MKDKNLFGIINLIFNVLVAFILLYFFIWSFSRGKNYGKIELMLANDHYSTDNVMELEKEYRKDNNIAFWKQIDCDEIINDDLNRSATTNVIAVRGDSRLLINEGIPLRQEDDGVCVIGEKTAFDLFGNVKVEGLTVNYHGREYRIADVLSGDKEVFVYQVQQGEMVTFDRMSALVKADETGKKCINRLAMQYGIFGTLVDYEFEFFVIRLLAVIILIILLMSIIRKIKKNIFEKYNKWKYVALVTGAVSLVIDILIIIICVKWLLLPTDYIPTGWSDYLYWGEFFSEKLGNLKTLLLMKKNIPDYDEYFTIYKFFALSIIALLTRITQIACHRNYLLKEKK